MADSGLPRLTEWLTELRRVRREAAYAEGKALSRDEWWASAAREAPELADAVAERDKIYPASHHRENLAERRAARRTAPGGRLQRGRAGVAGPGRRRGRGSPLAHTESAKPAVRPAHYGPGKRHVGAAG